MNRLGYDNQTFQRIPTPTVDLSLAERIPPELAERCAWFCWAESTIATWHCNPLGFAGGLIQRDDPVEREWKPRQYANPADERLTLSDALHWASVFADWEIGIGLVVGNDFILTDFDDIEGFVALALSATD